MKNMTLAAAILLAAGAGAAAQERGRTTVAATLPYATP